MSQAIINSRSSGYESINASLRGSRDQYEAFSDNAPGLHGLGEDLNSVTFATDGGYVLAQGSPGIYPSDSAIYSPTTTLPNTGFNWNQLFGGLISAGAQTGLSIAKSITNPAYTTPGAFTRLADGTIITTAGNPVTGSGLPANILGSSFSGSSLLLLAGVAVVAVMFLKK